MALRLAAASVALLATVACGGGDDAAPDTGAAPGGAAPDSGVTVPVLRLAYDPTELSVPAGTTVTWRNDEPIGHTVTSGEVSGVDGTTGLRASEKPDGTFDGPLDTKGSTFEFRFTKPGTYGYYCAIHKGMNARVVVA